MRHLDMAAALRQTRSADPGTVPDIVARVATTIGGTDLVIYLVDFAQTTLQPLPSYVTYSDVPTSESVTGTMAGRAFLDQTTVSVERDDGVRVWAPLLEGSDRTGVVAVTVASASPEMLAACEDLATLAGYLIGIHARNTDIYNVYRRRKPMSLAASIQWEQLPPLTLATTSISVAGLVEPAYDVGGDCFDYAVNGPVCEFGVFDAVGHNLDSALLASLALNCYRRDRREGALLGQMHSNLDDTIGNRYADGSYATGQLARLDLTTGALQWTSAGHPGPLLIRHGQYISDLGASPTLPWGLGHYLSKQVAPEAVPVAVQSLEPGDTVLFFSDGSIEARSPGGEPFGIERLADLAGRHTDDNLAPHQIVRRLSAAVLEHNDFDLQDDAMFLMVRWFGP